MADTLPGSTLEEILAAARMPARDKWTYTWWRGHADAKWLLTPKLFRGIVNPIVEHSMLLKFQAKAGTRYTKCPRVDDVPGWLTLMQHYRLPTRLLDWTTSILVAAYFAASEVAEQDGVIWGLNPSLANHQLAGVYGILVPSHAKAKELLDDAFTGKLQGKGTAVAMIPSEFDLRMLLQQSMFTVHGSKDTLDNYFNAGSDWPFVKITVPTGAKQGILRDLTVLGIRRSSLFPDLESLSADIVAEPNW